jgi:hypothetical protein
MTPGTALPSVAIASPFDAYRLPFNGIIYEFCKVAAEVAQATLIAPAHAGDRGLAIDMVSPLDKARREMLRGLSALRHRVGLPRLPTIRPARLERRYDAFFYACSFVHDLTNLDRIEGWERSGVKAVFILESWSNLLASHARTLRYLDAFDHVFLLNRSSVPNVQRYTRTPCSFLPLAADALVAAPGRKPPPRTIDVYSMGRRAPVVHAQLVEAMMEGRLFYQFDQTGGGTVLDWAESRALTAQLIKRSRFFMAFDHTIGSARKADEAAGEVALSARYFEGAAGGAVMLGSAPPIPEFHACFDWPDAVIDIPREPENMTRILSDLEAQPGRLARIRRTNVLESLYRHDWSHRWQTVARALDLPDAPAMAERHRLLDALAAAPGVVAAVG